MNKDVTNSKTKKIRENKHDKKLLWDQFNQECNNEEKPLECIYRKTGQRENCAGCEANLSITDEGFLACTNINCGIVYHDILDQSAEWRFYGADDNHSEDPTRCGMPINPLLKESSYGCKIVCKSSSTYEMRKIRRYTEWQSMPYREKSQYDEFQKITSIAHIAGIPKMIIEDAMRYHKKISEARTFRGLNRDGIIAASIYIACRINSYPRTAKEIATMFHLDNTSATKGCKNAITIINDIEKNMENNDKTSLCKAIPQSFIERYCSKLNINVELTRLCIFVAIRIHNNNLIPENTPHSIAAGIVYFVAQICNLNISKKDVNQISRISEVTINKCYKKLDLIKTELIPSPILEKYS
jgi:transcription initiation factor TFIIB